ncbi:MAG: DUF4386 domain-containing protein [Synechococcaceae cyanobacterium]|nr:DUF4386 domain-containing protein [Synechococcaceae cyanobacterium]
MTADGCSLRPLARTAGGLYLAIIVLSGFAEAAVRSGLIVPGEPAATADNILAAPTLFRLGFLADLAAFQADAAVAVLLYVLLRPTNGTLALLAMVFRLLAHPAIGSLNLLHHLGALLILEDSGPLRALPRAERDQLALFSLDLHGYGYLIAGAFFAVHCALLGWLLHGSGRFPRILGILLGASAAGYLFETCAAVMAPGLAPIARGVVVVTATAGEGALCLYLLIRGVRSTAWGEEAPEGQA